MSVGEHPDRRYAIPERARASEAIGTPAFGDHDVVTSQDNVAKRRLIVKWHITVYSVRSEQYERKNEPTA